MKNDDKKTCCRVQEKFPPKGKELEAFYCIINKISDEVVILDADGYIIYANEAAVRGLGFSLNSILSSHITKFHKEEISTEKWKQTFFKQIKKSKVPISFTFERIVKDNKQQRISANVSYMKCIDREYVLSISRDITEKLNLRSQLNETERQYKQLSNKTIDGLFIIDLKGILVEVNDNACSLLKCKRKELRGKHFSNFISENSLDKAWKLFDMIKKGSPISPEVINLRNNDGISIPVEFNMAPHFVNNELCQMTIFVKDISEKIAYDNLKIETDKMIAMQDLIFGITQEIINPLKGIFEVANNLVTDYKNRDFEYIGFKEYKSILKTIETINAQVKYCYETSDRLSQLNKVKAGVSESSCFANTVIREAVKLNKDLLDAKDIVLTLKLYSKLPKIQIGKIELNQIITNILMNSTQAINVRGKIEIISRVDRKNNLAIIEFRDDGVGIKPEILSRVFDPFFTTKQRGVEKNSGLGLTIVYSLVKNFKGDIIIHSNVKTGTIVKVMLPLSSN